MSQQTINVGTSPNDGTGTPLRTAFQYTNSNFSELYTAVGPSGNNIVVPGSATITGDLTVKTNVLKVDSTNNRVGILTASPTVDLEIGGGTGTRTAKLSGVTNIVDVGFGSLRGGSTYGDLRLWTDRFRIYNNAGTQIIKNVNGTNGAETWYDGGGGTRMTLDSSGNLGLGVTPSAGKGCLQLVSGITFPATQVASSDANTLDDYEEGTWSPTITAGSGTPTTVTVNSASYTKIGRVVVAQVDFTIVNKGTATTSLLFTLPFTSASLNQCGAFRETSNTGNMGQIYSSGTTQAGMQFYGNTTVWADTNRIAGTFTYFAA